jgi:hypothetical protein
MKRILLLMAAIQVAAAAEMGPVDRAFERMYNFDFASAHTILNELERQDPSYALTYSVRASALLFSELDRMKILETDFFTNDDTVTDKKRLKPDPAARARLFEATAAARRTAEARLAVAPTDPDAMFAMCMATGVETDYTILVEKKYFRSFKLSKESQTYARRLLALDPPVYDAYVTLGSAEYVVGSMNFIFRLFVRFDDIKGSKQKAMEDLKKVISHGRYYPPFAKILLSVIYLREKQPAAALQLLTELAHDYPENRLLRNEVARTRLLVAKK